MIAAPSFRIVSAVLALGLGAGAPLASASALALAPPQQAKDDVVTFKDNREPESGKVVSENFDALELEVKKGVKKKLEWAQLASVKYASVPEEYTEAVAERSNDPEGALEKLKALSGTEGLGDVWRQQVMYDVASLQQQLGAFDEAVASWKALLAAFPEGRYLGAAARGLVDSTLAKGDADGAGKALDGVAASPAVGKFGGLDPVLKVLRGRILAAQGKFADARAAFEQVEKDPKAPAEASAAAKLGVAECLKSEGKDAEAETRFKALVEGDGPNFLLAGAWNGLGDMLSEKAAKARNADQLTEALYAYLRGVVQYTPAAGEPQDQYERALAGSARCFKGLSELESNKDRKAYYAGQYAQQVERLRKLSPNSEYLKQI